MSMRRRLAGLAVSALAILSMPVPAQAGSPVRVSPTRRSVSVQIVTRLTATITRASLNEGDQPDSTAVGLVKAFGCKGDHAGHLVAKVLGGPGTRDNIVPMNPSTNRSTYRRFENTVQLMVEQWGEVDLEINLTYDREHPLRPTRIEYIARWRDDQGHSQRQSATMDNRDDNCN